MSANPTPCGVIVNSFPVPRILGTDEGSPSTRVGRTSLLCSASNCSVDSCFSLCQSMYENGVRCLFDKIISPERNRQNTFPKNASMICSYCQFLTDIAALPEIHYICLVVIKVNGVLKGDSRPPMISRFDSIGKACMGTMSVVPSGTPCSTR